jgi:4-carboxymuconolactone decarboxylase
MPRPSLIPFRRCASGRPAYSGPVDTAEALLRRLALNDEQALRTVLTRRAAADRLTELGYKVEILVRLAALLAIGAATPSLRETVEQAVDAGASDREIVGVLISVGPTIGLASLVASAPRLAAALKYDLEDGYGGAGGVEPGNDGDEGESA